VSDRASADPGDDRLIFLSDALGLVPFSETTLRRAIARGELEAWQPNKDGKLVMWRSTLIAWATRRPAQEKRTTQGEREPVRSSSRRRDRSEGPVQPAAYCTRCRPASAMRSSR
jgi:hypothetical protein